ncbi:MAG TPA: hypothetical protein VLZ83_09785 [Edaphocola sp.]|nr:hypothetical protein [Edaphocola sp.]
MKKKVIFAVATGLFALAMVFNMNVLQLNNAGDVSLESIAVMAQAQTEYIDPNEFDGHIWDKKNLCCAQSASHTDKCKGKKCN